MRRRPRAEPTRVFGRPKHQSRSTRHRSKATDRSRPPLSVSALNCSGSVRQRLAIVGGRPALAFSSSIPISRSSRWPHDHPAHEPPKGIGGAFRIALHVRSEYTDRHQGRPSMLGVPDPRVKPSPAGQRYRPSTHAPTAQTNPDRTRELIPLRAGAGFVCPSGAARNVRRPGHRPVMLIPRRTVAHR